MKSTSKPTDIFAKLNAMVGYAPDEEIELYEVRSLTYLDNLQGHVSVEPLCKE